MMNVRSKHIFIALLALVLVLVGWASSIRITPILPPSTAPVSTTPTPTSPAPTAPPSTALASTRDPVPSGWPRTILNPFGRMTLEDLYGDAEGKRMPTYPEALCELNVLYTGNCLMEEGRETWLQCVARVGAKNFDKILSSRCRKLPVWQSLLANDTSSPGPLEWTKLKRGFVYESEIYTDETIPYIPPAKRTVATFLPPRRCSNGCLHYPISFAMPKANIATSVSRHKWWGFVPYLPAWFPLLSPKYVLGVQDEWLKDQLHRHSYFAFTHRRGGWDCMRHLDILSSGAVPYFADIELLPNYTLANYPKDLIKRAMALPGVRHVGQTTKRVDPFDTEFLVKPGDHVNFKKPGTVRLEEFDLNAYFDIADQILNHTRHHLTSEAVVAYMLRAIGYEEPRHVLMIGRWVYDYLHQSIENGLSDLGIKTYVLGHDGDWLLRRRVIANEPPTEESMEQYRSQWGPGASGWMFGYRNLPHVTRHTHKGRKDTDVKKLILEGEFDLVIYSYTENEPVTNRWYWDEVNRTIPKERRIFLHHNDDIGDPDEGSMTSCEHGTLFKREMHDVRC